MTDQELRDLVANTAIIVQNLAIQSAKTDEQLAKTDAQLAKTDAQLAETDAKLTQLAEQFAIQSAKTDEQLAKTDAQLAKTDAKLNKLAKLFGDVNNNRGEMAEEFFFTSLKKKPIIAGIKFETVHRNLHGSKGRIQDEFDLVLVNGDSLAIIETKNKAHLKLVDQMVEKKIPNFKILFPQFSHYKIYAGIASMVSYDDLKEKVEENGLFLLTQQGKHIELTSQNMVTF
jgi:hypothetical protein